MKLAALIIVLALLLPGVAAAATTDGRIGPALSLTANGRLLRPAGDQVAVGNFPMAGALTPDGRFYWAVDAGHGRDDVQIVDLAQERVVQVLPLPGAGWGIAFAPDGRTAYVPGTARGDSTPAGPTKGDAGDVVHVFSVDPASGRASEQNPITLPPAGSGSAQGNSLPPVYADFPAGTAVSEDGERLAVVLSQADALAIVDLAGGGARTVRVGAYPLGVAIKGGNAYVSNEYDGTLSVVDLAAGRVTATIDGLGGTLGDRNSHPQAVLADPHHARVYVAVANRDLVAVVDTNARKAVQWVSVARGSALGTQPVALALAPDSATLYAADAGEDAVAAIALTDRSGVRGGNPGGVRVYQARSVKRIARYRKSLAAASRRLRRDLSRIARRGPATRRRQQARRRRIAYDKLAARLKRDLLTGKRVRACAGPTRAQDARYGAAILRALARRDADLRRARRAHGRRRAALRRAASQRAQRAYAEARRQLPAIRACPRRVGVSGGPPAYSLIGRIPTAAYPTDVQVTPDGARLLWTAGKGLGSGPNPTFTYAGSQQAFAGAAPPYGSYVADMLIGRVGILDRPSDAQAAADSAQADAQVQPSNAEDRPADSPIPAAGSGPSAQIQHVFYIVRENRTYDQVFGTDPRGDGAPNLELFDDNGVPGPTGGITPNAHALAHAYPLLDHVYADSEVSVDGHLITAGATAIDYVQRATQANYSARGRATDFGIYPVTFGPRDFIFDQSARQGVSFFNYGELSAGATPAGDDGRSTYRTVAANTDLTTYPATMLIGCQAPAQPPTNCTQDSDTTPPTGSQSRVQAFRARFADQLATGAVPRLSYLTLPNDHTNGTTPNAYSPQALVADNDLALGQIVDTISHSSIWPRTAIFVVEDDSQDGADHVDAHRIPALVISPWARSGPVHTRYDQYSVLRTIGLILGLTPLSLNDALATPMYDVFRATPRTDSTVYTAIQPDQSLTATNSAGAPAAQASARLPFTRVDAVPQAVSDRILWRAVHGARSRPPAPGPNASREEHERALEVLRELR